MPDRSLASSVGNSTRRIHHRLIDRIYTDHNRSRTVQDALARCLNRLDAGGKGLNVGAGSGPRLHPGLVNLDIAAGPTIDVVATAEQLPFDAGSFDLVISQETLEHVRDPFAAVREMFRVLRPGGLLYCQVPFIIGYHPGPTDYWRFTREGAEELVKQAGFACQETGASVGPATGFYRICVEFLAVAVGSIAAPLYYPAKGMFAVLLYPVKLLDRVLRTQADRIPGGYYVIAVKPDESMH